MRRTVVAAAVSLACLVVAPRLAAAAGCSGNCDPTPHTQTGVGMTESTWLKWAIPVDAAFMALHTYELATWKRNSKISGFEFVMTLPVTVCGIDFIKQDSHDWKAWTVTVWSAALMVDGFWPVIRHELHGSDTVDPKSGSWHVLPTTLASWDDGTLHTGVAITGSF